MDMTLMTEAPRRATTPSGDRQGGEAPLSPDELRKLDAYWRAANYLAVGQIYLLDNPLLKEPLRGYPGSARYFAASRCVVIGCDKGRRSRCKSCSCNDFRPLIRASRIASYWEPLDFELPRVDDEGPWRRWIDTTLDSPRDIVPWEEAPTVPGGSYRVGARSVAMLVSLPRAGARPSTPRDEAIAEISLAPTGARPSGRQGSIGGFER